MEKYLQDLSHTLQMLPLDDRAYLADLLLRSLSPSDPISDEEYEEDMRRLKEAHEHPETTVAWEDIKAEWDASDKAN